MKIILYILLFLPLFSDGQVSAAKRLLIADYFLKYDQKTYIDNWLICEDNETNIGMDGYVMFKNYEGTYNYDSLQIVSVNEDYDGDGYAGFTILENYVGGGILSPPETFVLDDTGHLPSDKQLLINYDNIDGDSNYVLCTSSPQQCAIGFRIKDENGVLGSVEYHIVEINYTP